MPTRSFLSKYIRAKKSTAIQDVLGSVFARTFHVSKQNETKHLEHLTAVSDEQLGVLKAPKKVKIKSDLRADIIESSQSQNLNIIDGDEPTSVKIPDSILLRDYQHECIESIIDNLSQTPTPKIGVSIATGGGKTVIFSMTIPKILKLSRFEGDTANGILILVHRRELANQTIKTIQNLNIWDGNRIFLDMGKNKIDPRKVFGDPRPFIIIGSVPTLARSKCSRLSEYETKRIKAVIVDECHHAVSESYKNIFKVMNCSKDVVDNNRDSPYLVGFTATMARSDKVPLKEVFDKIVFQKNIASLITENHLCDFDWMKVQLGMNLDNVAVSGGDFRLDSLAEHVNTEEVNVIVLKTYLKMKSQYPKNMKSLLVFCVNVQHMQDLSTLFRMNDINAQYVSGETKPSERDRIVTDFKSGKVEVLFNCGVFTEGTDIPNIDSIFLLRPTKSKPLLIQMVGRGLRLATGKEKLLVTDFVDNKSLGLTITSTLNGKHDVINLLGSASGGRFNNGDIVLPGDMEYIKFTNYKWLDMLYEKPNSNLYQLKKSIKQWNTSGTSNTWTQVKYNTWATSCGIKSYFKITRQESAELQLTYCMTKIDYQNTHKLINVPIAAEFDFAKIQQAFNQYMLDHEAIKNIVDSLMYKEKAMKLQKLTSSQAKFIRNTITNFILKSKSSAFDEAKFFIQLEEMLKGMSRWEAYEIIFGYTISKNQYLMLWIKKTFLNNKEKRKLITKDTILKERQNLVDDGWV